MCKANATVLWDKTHYDCIILSNALSSSVLCPCHSNLLLLGEALKCDYFTTDNKGGKTLSMPQHGV